MFRLSLIFMMACAGLCLAADAATIPEIEGPRAAYQKALADIRAKRYKDAAPATQNYSDRLVQLYDKFSNEGEKDAALAVKAEQERLAMGVDPTMEEQKAMSGLLLTTRTAYVRARDIAYTAAAKVEAQAHEAWARGLADLQARFTKAGHLDKAAIVKAERDKIAPATPPPHRRPN